MSLLPLLWLPLLVLVAPSAPQDRLARPGNPQAGPAGKVLRAPEIHVSSAGSVQVDASFDMVLVVDDPDGDPVDLRLLNPPAGMSFLPRKDLATPATVRLRWIPQKFSMGWNHLVFEASDDTHTTRATVSVEVHGREGYGTGFLFADVDEDGRLDMLAMADDLETYGQETGAIHVWTELNLPPATGTVPELAPQAYLHSTEDADFDAVGYHRAGEVGQTMQLADFTGDGILDVVVLAGDADVPGGDRAAILVWDGAVSPAGSVPPVAVLHASEDALLCESERPEFPPGSFGLRLHDVTGDGHVDAIAVSSRDPYEVTGNGMIYVWAGGPASTGTRGPTATLVGANDWDFLGSTFGGHEVHFGDVTGDGISDVVAGAPTWTDPGSVYVWAGGTSLTGTPAPTATLRVTGSCNLAYGGTFARGLHLADVVGDATLDVIASDVCRGVHAWQGGASLTGLRSPDSSLLGPRPAQEAALLTADVTGDGQDDVLVGDGGHGGGQGAVRVWIGGSLTTHSTLTDPGRTGVGSQMLVHDLTGDGLLDVVAMNGDAVLVWEGGSFGPGQTVQPSARLDAPSGGVVALRFADVTGDGCDDPIASSPFTDVGGAVDAGAVYVWEGGCALQGDVPPLATLTSPDPRSGDELGGSFELDPTHPSCPPCPPWRYTTSDGLQIGDVTGDGIDDLVVGAPLADVGTTSDAGAVFAWQGGSTLVGSPQPFATLTIPGAIEGDRWSGGRGQSLRLAEVTGDEVLDVFVLGIYADVTEIDSGGIAYWPGGSALGGAPTPWILAVEDQSPFNFGDLGDGVWGEGLFLVDVSGDGRLDVVAKAGRHFACLWTALPGGPPNGEIVTPDGFVVGYYLGG